MDCIRIYEMPACKMVSSGRGMFGDGVLEAFGEWFGAFPREMFQKDFLWHDGQGFVWYYLYAEGMNVPDAYSIIDFPGGLYASAVGKDADEEAYRAVMAALDDFIENSCFEKDPDRAVLGSIITSPKAAEALGYEQMEYFVPIRMR